VVTGGGCGSCQGQAPLAIVGVVILLISCPKTCAACRASAFALQELHAATPYQLLFLLHLLCHIRQSLRLV
jgi:hypothetical protein